MKRISILLVIVLMVGLPLALSAEAYDKEVVVQNMRANVARIGAIKAAVAAEDFFAAAQAFFAYSEEAAVLQKMDPPKGSKEEWAGLWGAFQYKALTGVGACGERDAEKALKILDELVAFNKVGHPMFRS
jgi:hypothetical protein